MAMDRIFEHLDTALSARGIATITFDRPDRGNAMHHQMIEELLGHLESLATDGQARVIVLRGSGRHFCTGADLAQRGGPAAPASATRAGFAALLEALDSFPKPVIALVQGGCVGGGVAVAACCDVVIALDDAFFSFPELRLGLVPGNLLPYFVRSIGYRAFRRYGLSGERMTADEARHHGLVHHVGPRDRAEAQLDEIADAMLHAAPGALRQLKQRLAVFGAMPTPLPAEAEDPARRAEIEEGTASFKEKRKPSWYPPAS
jgi:methylglutaconyl-CoA hydratase